MPPLTSWLSDRLPDLVGSPLAANGGSQFDRIRRLAGVEDRPTSPVRPLAAAMMASLLVAVLVTAATQPREARADELSADTNKIESLTVEQARKLVGERAAKLVFDGGKRSGNLSLDGVTTLAPETARELATHKGFGLSLNDLLTVNAATAKGLAEFKGDYLSLGKLTSVDADTAEAIAGFKGGRLSLAGLAALDAATARRLAGWNGRHLNLSGLTTLSTDTADALAQFKGNWLVLSGLNMLDTPTAKALAKFNGEGMYLMGLTTLDAEAARHLAEFKGGFLSLAGLTTLEAATARRIAEFKGIKLCFESLTELDAEGAAALAEYTGYLVVPVSVQRAFLAKNPLTPGTAAAWAVLSDGDLSAVTAFESPDSVAIARVLATRKRRLSLPNLKRISPKTLSALIEKEDVEIPLIETLELIPEPDGGATDDFVIPPRLEVHEQRKREMAEQVRRMKLEDQQRMERRQRDRQEK